MSLPDHFSLTNHKTQQEVEIFMSYGMLNDLMKIFNGQIEAVLALDLDPQVAEPVMATLLAKRDETGKILENPIFDISIQEASACFDWVKEHITDFFLTQLSSTKRIVESRAGVMEALGLSPNGLANAPSKTL